VAKRHCSTIRAYPFELKLDGFRGIANTVRGRMLSKNGHRLRRFEPLLDAPPPGHVFDETGTVVLALFDSDRWLKRRP